MITFHNSFCKWCYRFICDFPEKFYHFILFFCRYFVIYMGWCIQFPCSCHVFLFFLFFTRLIRLLQDLHYSKAHYLRVECRYFKQYRKYFIKLHEISLIEAALKLIGFLALSVWSLFCTNEQCSTIEMTKCSQK